MDKTEFLKQLINETGLKMKTFAEKADIPYTTLRSMLERGIENASVNNVIKVCKQLDICVETLYDMCKKDINISSEEKTLLENYNKLNDLGKKEAAKRVSELTEINKYMFGTTNEICATLDNIVELKKKEITYDDFETVAAHNDGLTDDEISEADRRILADINKRNNK